MRKEKKYNVFAVEENVLEEREKKKEKQCIKGNEVEEKKCKVN